MGLASLVLYGVGDMLGAGIYALIGKVAGVMGNAIWLAFLASMCAALLTGLSYASLGSRYPRAAGVAFVAQRAFGRPFLSHLIGFSAVASALTSMGAGARAFAGYGLGMLGHAQPGTLAVVGVAVVFLVFLALVTIRGMRESLWVNALCTALEAFGLLLIIAVGLRFWGGVDYLETPPSAAGMPSSLGFTLVLQGAVLTFYSFIGFDDMINVTEEVKDPRRTFPLGVLLALGITTVIYIAVSITAVSVVPAAELNRSGQPLVEVVRRAAPWFPPAAFSLIALFAIMNTALLNFIMSSRLLYGLARQGLAPRALGRIHPTRRTPHVAILALLGVVVVLAASGDVSRLASATSALLLMAFIGVNVALLVLQRRPGEPQGSFEVPAFVPAAGAIVCAVILCHVQLPALLTALALLTFIGVMYWLVRPRRQTAQE
jgi:amino acid transporter